MTAISVRDHFQHMADALTAEAFEFAEAGAEGEACAALNDAAIYNSVVRYIDEATTSLDFVFSRSGDDAFDLAFVEVEDGSGRSVSAGRWFKRADGYDILRVDLLSAPAPSPFEPPSTEVMEQLRAEAAQSMKALAEPVLTDEEAKYVEALTSAAANRVRIKGDSVYVGRWPRRKRFAYEVAISAATKVGA